ncbi:MULTISPECIES: NAD-dependent succinate-semialdehyde dehydrogenase [Corynebacterium]|uniref:NAD-dependent succinate-semialdehyde dehydrogenase n=1 Tax=Corynebacterium TaxID=1716 RepID=UPI00124EDB42|nr:MULTISPECIES: NAD-dependent succinate-semialdehyde dehydrogenase [Corynebacterium]
MSIDLDAVIADCPTQLFINGEFVDARSGETFEVENPSDGSVLATVAKAGEADAVAALDAAVAVQQEWAATAPRERAEILRRAFELLTKRSEELAYIMSAELGRALPDSRGEVAYGAEFFRWFAEEAVRISGDYRITPAGGGRVITIRQPVGPVLAITPWNFPLSMGTRKMGPVLASGCTMVLKPASKTPLTMLYLARILKEAGLPDGVINIIPGSGSAASSLLEDPRLRKFTFTGSTEVGQALHAKASEHTLGASLELGGNAPFIVCEDADLDKAVEAVKVAKMRGAGQVCIAANRFIVHEKLYDAFCERVTELIGTYTVGRGTDEGVTVGPLSGDDQVETVSELVNDAIAQGARVLAGGSVYELDENLPEKGSYFPPTVLADVPRSARIASEEIFGPVVAIYKASSDADAIEFANDTLFGLAGYVFTENLERALGAGEAMQVGMLAINKGAISDPSAPFGGVKQSGVGREGGFEGIDEYLETKLMALPEASL